MDWRWAWMQTEGAEGAPGFWVLLGKRDAVGTTRQKNHTALRKSSAKNSPAPGKERFPLPNSPSIPSSCLPWPQSGDGWHEGCRGHMSIHAQQLARTGDVWEHLPGAVQCFGSAHLPQPAAGPVLGGSATRSPQDEQHGVEEAEPAGLTAPGDGQMAGWRGRCV